MRYYYRPDTIFGASLFAIAPDHILSKQIASKSKEVNDFIKEWKKSFISEEDLDKAPKNGVFTKFYVSHPFTDKNLYLHC